MKASPIYLFKTIDFYLKNKLFFFTKLNQLLVCMLFLLINYSSLKAEGTKAIAPSTDDEVGLFIGAGNTGNLGGDYGQFAWKDSDSKLNFNIQNTCEKAYFGFSVPKNHRSYRDINPSTGGSDTDENLLFRIIDPNGQPINNIGCFGNTTIAGEVWQTLNSNTANITSRSDADNGPMQVGNAGGYAAFELDLTACGLTLTGDYSVEFYTTALPYNPNTPTSGAYVQYFDITVADCTNQALSGRLWSNNWCFAIQLDGDGPFDRAFNGSFYVCSEEGFITKIDFNSQTNTRAETGKDNDQRSGFRAGSFNVSFNTTGPANTGDILADRQSLQGVNEPNPVLKVFLNLPDETLCPEQPIGQFQAGNNFLGGCPGARCLNIEATQPGQIEILIEGANGNGVLDMPSERVLAYNITAANIVTNPQNPGFIYQVCIPWDEKDGLGNPVDLSEITITGFYNQGTYHFPVYDAEFNDDGFTVNTIRPNLGPQLLFYNDIQITELNNSGETKDGSAGCNAPCHRWTGEYEDYADKDDVYGNFNTINTWWFANTSVKDLTNSIKREPPLSIECPPDFTGCPDSSIDPDVIGRAVVTTTSNACPFTLNYMDLKLSDGQCAGAKTIRRIWTAFLDDDPSEMVMCMQTITLEDTVPPVIDFCPDDIRVTAAENECEVTVDLEIPIATDNCAGDVIISSSYIGNTFPLGTTTVIITATDGCGNKTTCEYEVVVENPATLECPDDILVTCDRNVRTAVVSWEPPTGNECCSACDAQTAIAGYEFLGERGGTRYYLSQGKKDWANALATAESDGGYLVTINDPAENQFLAQFLIDEYAYIGLADIGSEGSFYWLDGTPVNYTNWYKNQPNNYKNNQNVTQLMYNGQWNDIDVNNSARYFLEVPCYQVTQIAGPLNGSKFPEGKTTITYEVSYDNCINADTCSFEVEVEECPTNYCRIRGTDQRCFWIERVQLGDINNTSGNNGGYGDYSHLSTNLPLGSTQTITLVPGYPQGHVSRHNWTVWIDFNRNGDFEDAGEKLFTIQTDKTIHVDFTVPEGAELGQTGMRVAMKFVKEAESCTSFVFGEVEDYSVNIVPKTGSLNYNDKGDELTEMEAKSLDLNTPNQNNPIFSKLSNGQTAKVKLSVYPNPTKDLLNVQLEDYLLLNSQVHIYNNLGQSVFQQTIPDRDYQKIEIPVNNLANGIYLLSIEQDGQPTILRKFTKVDLK